VFFFFLIEIIAKTPGWTQDQIQAPRGWGTHAAALEGAKDGVQGGPSAAGRTRLPRAARPRPLPAGPGWGPTGGEGRPPESFEIPPAAGAPAPWPDQRAPRVGAQGPVSFCGEQGGGRAGGGRPQAHGAPRAGLLHIRGPRGSACGWGEAALLGPPPRPQARPGPTRPLRPLSLVCDPEEEGARLRVRLTASLTALGPLLALGLLVLICRKYSLMRKIFPPIPHMKDPLSDSLQNKLMIWEAGRDPREECPVAEVQVVGET
uniref:Uncharacterized protein n=1 Tax=Equus caballus TaxID=9796 RepID=A0A9L0RFD6_HORSE